MDRAQGATHDGKVLGIGKSDPSVDESMPDNYPVTKCLFHFPKACISLIGRYIGINFLKGIFVKQDFDSFPGCQLPFGMLFGFGFFISL